MTKTLQIVQIITQLVSQADIQYTLVGHGQKFLGLKVVEQSINFWHCYGMKLVELHLDDAAIAHLLGHRGVNTVYRYRRASGKLMVKETEELRKTRDEILSEIIKEWDGYEQVFQNG